MMTISVPKFGYPTLAFRWSTLNSQLPIILSLLIVAILHVNNHRYYDFWLGYDMPQHFNNMYAVMTTGTMPPPPLQPTTYEAFQAPLYYILTAWFTKFANHFTLDSFQSMMPALLFGFSMLWTLLVGLFVNRMLRRASFIFRTFVIVVVMLFPVNTHITVMFANDFSATLFGALSIMTLWLMCRTNRLTNRGWWLRAAALTGFATAFKLTGTIMIGVYLAFATYLVLHFVLRHDFSRAKQIIRFAAPGLPLMLAPMFINMWHSSRYLDNAFGATAEPRNMWDVVGPSFFTTFDTDIFAMPFAFEAGAGSYWTLQYVTLHSDYYNTWGSSTYADFPPDELMTPPIRDPMPWARFHDAITLQYLAVPISFFMVFAVGVSAYRIIFRRRQALRDGSVLVLIYFMVAELLQLLRFANFPSIQDVLIHARFLGFLYGFLFIIGMWWFWKLTPKGRLGFYLRMTMIASMMAYSYVAIRLMWLPAV